MKVSLITDSEEYGSRITYILDFINNHPLNTSLFHFQTGGNPGGITLYYSNKGKEGNYYRIGDHRLTEILSMAKTRGYQIGLHGSYNSFDNQKMFQEKMKTLYLNILRFFDSSEHNCLSKVNTQMKYPEATFLDALYLVLQR